jgi:hypothetical protein
MDMIFTAKEQSRNNDTLLACSQNSKAFVRRTVGLKREKQSTSSSTDAGVNSHFSNHTELYNHYFTDRHAL